MGILDDVVVNAKSAAETVGKTAEKWVDVSKLKASISETNSVLAKKYQALGEYVFENCRDQLAGDFEAVGRLTEIEEQKVQLESLCKALLEKQNKTICPTCGKASSTQDLFCSQCGTRINFVQETVVNNEPCCEENKPEAPDSNETNTQG